MVQLAREPKVVSLAKELRLDWRGDCLKAIRDYALARVQQILSDSPVPIDSLDSLRFIVANKFRVKLEFIRDEEDLDQIAAEYGDFHPLLGARLKCEFRDSTTEGITLERHAWDPRFFRYLAVVDARGERAARAYFSAWHELAHLLIHPEQLPFPGFRRTPSESERLKDPLESVVDHVAGRIAFYPPYFGPALRDALEAHGGLTFSALEAARDKAAPTASLLATAMGSLQLVRQPALLVSAGMALKAAERRIVEGQQESFAFATDRLQEKLRVTMVVPNDVAPGFAIRRNMRVPAACVLSQAFANDNDVTLEAEEDQASWVTSRGGALAAMPIRVQAARRGRYVYGLITPR